jgi:hypothetical protein
MMTPKQLAVELDARLNGPHDDEHTAAAADLAAEAIRYLNYATGPHAADGMHWPSTAYEVTAGLYLAASRLAPCLDQLGIWLYRQDAAGLVGTDDGAPAADVVAAAYARFRAAARKADALAADLSALQSALSGLNGNGPDRAAGGDR